MNWLKKIPGTTRCASGLEWTLWRMLPRIALLGTWVPLIGLGLLHLCADVQAEAAQLRWLQIADYAVVGAIIFHWTMVLTVGLGCVIVLIMKGPGYVADGYPLSHSDQPRANLESDEEAAAARRS